MGYDDSLPAPINMASQMAMAMVNSQSVHTTIQQLDHAAVALNNAEAQKDESLQQGQAALIVETLGIGHWMKIQFAFSTGGEDKALALVQQYHEELPSILDCDTEEEIRSETLASNIMLALSWENEEKSIPKETDLLDVPALVKANPLISFEHFTEEERAAYDDELENFSNTHLSIEMGKECHHPILLDLAVLILVESNLFPQTPFGVTSEEKALHFPVGI
ncbi:hypothetical protein R1sor_016844 [Riccia sorocarpa]|uniref:Uncharacterized protein n=1 Tax=Riccia sorocarpa TaxID=122646 RepID=A0ABD3HJR4_9MARC